MNYKRFKESKIRKAITISLVVIVSSVGIWVYTPFIFGYFEGREFVRAMGTCPYIFGGQITYFQPVCIFNSTAGDCSATCPLCTGALVANGLPPQACTGLSEIQYAPVPGTTVNFVCPPKTFTYIGNPYPYISGWLLGCGASPVIPYYIGISTFSSYSGYMGPY